MPTKAAIQYHPTPIRILSTSQAAPVSLRKGIGRALVRVICPAPTFFPLACVHPVRFNDVFYRLLENNKCNKTCRAKTISVGVFVVQLSHASGNWICNNSSWNSEFVQIQEADKCCLIPAPLTAVWLDQFNAWVPLGRCHEKHWEQKWNSNKSEICNQKWGEEE